MAILKKIKVINKKQGSEDILAFADQLDREAQQAPNIPTKNFYKRMARDIRVAHKVHFSTTR